MKIAVPVTITNEIDTHFGHCEFFAVYTISEKNEIIRKEKIDSPQGCGCKSNIASVLAEQGVRIMLAGGIGAGAINVLNFSGIEVIRGCQGNVDEVVKLFLEGSVLDSGSTCSAHEHGHNCQH